MWNLSTGKVLAFTVCETTQGVLALTYSLPEVVEFVPVTVVAAALNAIDARDAEAIVNVYPPPLLFECAP